MNGKKIQLYQVEFIYVAEAFFPPFIRSVSDLFPRCVYSPFITTIFWKLCMCVVSASSFVNSLEQLLSLFLFTYFYHEGEENVQKREATKATSEMWIKSESFIRFLFVYWRQSLRIKINGMFTHCTKKSMIRANHYWKFTFENLNNSLPWKQCEWM